MNSNGNGNGTSSKDGTTVTVTDLPDYATVKATIAKINEPQSKESNLTNLKALGSIPGLASLLHTNTHTGIPPSTTSHRRTLYGSNSLPSSPRATWLSLFIETFTEDECVQILMVAAVVSLAVGMYENPSTGYVEGVAILTACLIVSVVTATNDYQKETQFRELSDVNDDVDVLLIRDGKHVHLSVTEIVTGDLVQIEAGDSIPCDGILVKADQLEIDESALTGEPMDIVKDLEYDPFVLSGCIATAGTAQFIAIAVGKDSQWGVIKAALEKEQDQTPLQEKLDRMANLIGKFGIGAAVATFIAMMVIKLYVQPDYLDDVTVFSHALEAFIIGVTIVVVAVPEGLPLAVTISLAYSTKKMLADNNLIRHLQACETMGNATNICSDKTGTLTENRMTVVKGVFANVVHEDTAPESGTKVDGRVSATAKEILLQGIATCSTARILEKESAGDSDAHSVTKIVGNKTEGALLILADSPFFDNDDYSSRRADANFGNPGGSRLFPFSSRNKRMSVMVHKQDTWTFYHKGAGEIVLKDCTSYLDADGSIQPMTDAKRTEFENTITEFASQALRCVAMAHRKNIDAVVNPETATAQDCAEKCERELTLDALVGIVDPLRVDVVDAVKTCQRAGIFVRMVTGDNLETANAIAKQAGILTDGE
jgi:Ca2+-transporting ATPase